RALISRIKARIFWPRIDADETRIKTEEFARGGAPWLTCSTSGVLIRVSSASIRGHSFKNLGLEVPRPPAVYSAGPGAANTVRGGNGVSAVGGSRTPRRGP